VQRPSNADPDGGGVYNGDLSNTSQPASLAGELATNDPQGVTCRELIPAGSVFTFLAEHREQASPALMFMVDLHWSSAPAPAMCEPTGA
jgi:hypothetical protein